jgi:hypothetical protein
MHIDLNRVIVPAAGRRISQKKPEFKPILANVEFPFEQNSTGESITVHSPTNALFIKLGKV